MTAYLNQIKHARFNNHIYLLGNYENRITVYSQQIRATNLIYSLHKEKILKSTTKIAIIGAGTAGLTVATNAALLGVKNISIFEQGSGILPLWKNCTSRWLHPNIFSWPGPAWATNYTSLPILNWSSDIAANVAKQIARECYAMFEYYKKKININLHFNTKARILRDSNSIAWGAAKDESFDLIFVCVGFGRDGKKNDENTCYWANDNICALKTQPDNYFLSGTGDGGISDLLRIRIQDFDLNLLKSWLHFPEVQKLQERITKIEEEATRINIKESPEAANIYLKNEYGKIKTPLLTKAMKSLLRTDTSIFFHSKTKSLFNYSSFPLNRFLLSRYMQLNDPKFTFVHGEIINLEQLNNSGVSRASLIVNVKDFDDTKTDIFISRHGPFSPLKEAGLTWINESKIAVDIKARNSLDQTGREPVFDFEDYNRMSSLTKIQKKIKKEIIAIALVRKDDKFLFTQRAIKEEHLVWGFPAKRIRTDRKYNTKEAIISECEQETGVTPNPIKIVGKRVHPKTGHFLEYWLCDYVKGTPEPKDKNELKAVKWMEAKQIIKLAIDLYEPLKDVLYGRSI